MTRWASIEAFYAENPTRARSGESDFGVWWREPATPYPTYRVSVVARTGEIYSHQAGSETVELLGIVEHRESDLPTSLEQPLAYTEAERILDGWAEECGKDGSMMWLRGRLREAGVSV
jgi:hypothetical protein